MLVSYAASSRAGPDDNNRFCEGESARDWAILVQQHKILVDSLIVECARCSALVSVRLSMCSAGYANGIRRTI